ncbi:MAG: diaminopimelate epimerase [Planctomycetota bacterium]
MRFLKVEGAGNDFVLIDSFAETVTEPAALAMAMCDRHLGVGADGLLLVGPSRLGSVARMQLFNADGSEGRMCGNGLRCVIRWLAETGRAEGLVSVETAAGVRRGRMLSAEQVSIDMGQPSFHPEAIPVRARGDGGLPPEVPVPSAARATLNTGYCVSIGNPHVVVRVADPSTADLAHFGPLLANSPLFPEGANVHFLSVESPGQLVARPWERGVGATRACGTGAVASAVVARRLGWTSAECTRVSMPGGELHVRWDGEGAAWLEGPARTIFNGEWPGA